MPRNTRYECPRAGNMHQAPGDVYYCFFHDKYAQDRCQAFFDLEGSGLQCPELHAMIDEDTGKKYCEKHEPSSEIPEVADWKAGMTKWLTAVALAEPPHELGNDLPTGVVVGVSEPEPKKKLTQKPEPEPKPEHEPELHSETGIGTEGKLDIESETELNTCPKHTTQDGEPTLSKHAYTTGDFNTERDRDREAVFKAGPTPEQKPDRESDQELDLKFDHDLCLEFDKERNEESDEGLEEGFDDQKPDQKSEQKSEQERVPVTQQEHIVALYKQCNICLESHNAADMRKIAGCGHQYKEACLQDFLRRQGVRRYNCVGCRTWLQFRRF
ncbi:hypothetical protein PMIN06_010177 [Paraphaeosphaeria minitans]